MKNIDKKSKTTDLIPNFCTKRMMEVFDDGCSYDEACRRMAGIFNLFIGAAYNVAQGVMIDAVAEIRKYKDLYRYQMKYDATQALKIYDKIHAMQKRELGSMYETWLDAIDIIDDELKQDIQKFYWSLDSLLLKYNVDKRSLRAKVEVAYSIVNFCHRCFLGLVRLAERSIYHRKANYSELRMFSFEDVLFHWGRITDKIEKGLPEIDPKDDAYCNLALEIIQSKLLNYAHIEDCAGKALENHPDQDFRIDDGIEQLKEKYNNKVS